MTFLFVLAFFALGAIIASFVGLVVARLYTGEPILSGRSRCDACGVALHPGSLVPIFSYLFSGGRAVCCSSLLSPASLVSELALGVLFARAYALLGLTAALPLLLIALAALLALVLYDIAHQILPTRLLAVFLLASLAYALLASTSSPQLGLSLMTAGALALFLALINLLSGGRAMGLADAPLVFGLALLAGDLAISGFVYSFWIGSVLGIVVLLGRPPGSRIGIEVPFAPYLALGFLLALFSGWNLLPLIGASL